MSQLQERIAQFQKMANDDPTNELGHFRLGQLYLDDGQYENAIKSFRRTLELSPQFSKVYQLLGTALMKLGRNDEAVEVLQQGFAVADERGDNIPRDEMSKLLVQLGQPAPVAKRGQASFTTAGGSETGFRCVRPGCPAGRFARQLPKPPRSDDLGRQIYEKVCADCWNYWLRDLSIKVINEMRLDLSMDRSQDVYDQIMKETLGLE
jgi:tetratricopeptide (TPR) repeat protein